ncbi:MAG: hypothetical protein U9P50_02495 [Patescibacteria group bacterium]|nr:hypothetical protein [Patescibacteria group bacterium]
MTIERGSIIEIIEDIPSKFSSIPDVKKGTKGVVVSVFNGLFHIRDDEGKFNAFRNQIKEVKTD